MTAPFDDPGLATERTTLAWSRAAIALAAAGALLVRQSFEASVPEIGLAIGGADILIAAWLWFRADPRRAGRARLLRLMTAATVVTAVAAVALALLP